MKSEAAARPSWAIGLAALALLLGGLRDLRLAALGETAVFSLLWIERPALGPAAAWLPWLGWAALAALLGVQPLAALPVLARWSAVLGFAALAAGWGAEDRELWLKTLLAVAVPLAVAALWTGAGRGFKAEMTGLIPPYYNYTAFALAAAAAAGAATALHPKASRGLRWGGLGVALLGVMCIVLARSRGAVLGLGAAGALWLIRRWGRKAAWAIAVVAVVGAAVFRSGAGPQALRAQMLKTYRPYAEVRPQIWRAAGLIADEKPWLGEGPGSFGVGFRRHPVPTEGGAGRWGLSTEYAHSEVLQALGETGWPGLALWLIGMVATLAGLASGASPEPAREAAAAAAMAMAAQMTVDNMLQLPGLAFLFFSAAAVAGARPRGGARWPRAAAFAGAALALIAWIPRTLAADPGRAAVLFPAESDPREDLADRAMTAGRLDQADALWAQAAARAPFNGIYPWRRAQIAAARGHWAQAEAFAAAATALEPNFLRARVLRAEALARLGRRADARAELAEVLLVRERLRGAPVASNYDRAIETFDANEFARVSALAAGKSGRPRRAIF